jgi:hypothetical protein
MHFPFPQRINGLGKRFATNHLPKGLEILDKLGLLMTRQLQEVCKLASHKEPVLHTSFLTQLGASLILGS